MTLQVLPTRAFFHPGEPISLRVRLTGSYRGPLHVSIFHLGQQIGDWILPSPSIPLPDSGRGTSESGFSPSPYLGEGAGDEGKSDPQFSMTQPELLEVTGSVPAESRRGYLVRVAAGGETAISAFDVLDRWTEAPRYGFLHDFRPGRSVESVGAACDHLLALHVNGLQFYDWQYRHDTLLPPADDYSDPLGRPLSLKTVRALIEAAHARGIAAMPYTAIYGASPAFAADHPSWQLYDSQGQPYDFASGFLKIMNPDSGWQAHFVAECRRVLVALPFDGIHVDQYGEPTGGFDSHGAAVDLPAAFAATLDRLRAAIGTDKTMLFNLVHNWPAESLASSALDFWYSELWPPASELARLAQTVRDNRALCQRPTVLAVYIPPEHETTVIAAHSRILAAGASHIAHGEVDMYLSDAYFPKAGKPSEQLALRLQQAADFAVAYEEALVFARDVTAEWGTRLALSEPGVEAIIRCSGRRLFIHLLRSGGRWDEDIPARRPMIGVQVKFSAWPHGAPVNVWAATPESPVPQQLTLPDPTTLSLPPISEWGMVCLEFEESVS